MIRGLWAAASGMKAQEMQTAVVANNLANVDTAGFKKSRNNFQDLMYETQLIAGAITPGGGQIPTGIQVGMGVKPTSVQKIFTQGSYKSDTGNALDMAIEGDGFFRVLSGDEELYTRAGNFSKDSEGFITTAAGDRLQPEIAIPAEAVDITIQSNGRLTATDQDGEIVVEQDIPIYKFVNPGGLYSVGRNLVRPTDGSGDPVEGVPGTDGFGTISQYSIEMSNVSVVEEMVSMITGQRAYEANSKSIQTADSMLGIANGIKR